MNKVLSAQPLQMQIQPPQQIQQIPPETAGIVPEKFASLFFPSRRILVFILSICLVAGFGLRVSNLGAESLSEDELNKLQTVEDYRENGLTGRNGEHPFLMKGLQTASVTIAEKLNDSFFFESISDEAALRFPTALFGTFTALLIFFLIKELFGSSIGLIAAALWALDPNAIGFDRIAKEDSFLLFFFLLGNFFWVRAQSLAEQGTQSNDWLKYCWLAAAGFGGMIASKYMPHLLAVPAAYNKVFQLIPGIKWTFDRYRWLKFFIVMGISFVVFNPTILIPETWRQMMVFASEKRIGHDAYEFMGELYRNQMTAWLKGVPWTFYYIFILVKTPLLTLIFFFVGLPAIFRRKMCDGRFFLFFWAFMWFLPFTFLGGKFMRYFTVAQPLILIVAAIGCYFAGRWMGGKLIKDGSNLKTYLSWALPVILIVASFVSSFYAAPHFRLYTNVIGRGNEAAGYYFPHDEFYDTSTRDIVEKIVALNLQNGAVVANETPGLLAHYLAKTQRPDLVSVSLSDKTKTVNLTSGDIVVTAKGRRYFSNDAYLRFLENEVAPAAEIRIREITSAKIYRLDEEAAAKIRDLAKD